MQRIIRKEDLPNTEALLEREVMGITVLLRQRTTLRQMESTPMWRFPDNIHYTLEGQVIGKDPQGSYHLSDVGSFLPEGYARTVFQSYVLGQLQSRFEDPVSLPSRDYSGK